MNFLFTIFLSAFLLFQIQPLIAKQILPHFGGGAAIWTACMLFFQGLLFVGYLYAHILTKLRSVKVQAYIHLGLVIACWFVLPMTLSHVEQYKDVFVQSPLAGVMLLLASSVGLPYFLLATTGPLLQRWLSVIELEKLPYKLYSLSNIGSLLALVSFPFIFEPLLTIKQQSDYWSLLFVLFTGFLLLLCFKVSKQNLMMSTGQKDQTEFTAFALTSKAALWILLASIGVVLLISTTNAMTQNLPPVPFLWVMPLCLYLLSFIVCFHSPHWYVRWYFLVFFAIAALVGLLMYFIGSQLDIVSQIFIYAVIMFSGCMICHGELAKGQPKVELLTFYYLMIALGGFLGSLFVTFVAPYVFLQFSEYPIALVAVFILMAISAMKESSNQKALIFTAITVFILLSATFIYLNQAFVKTNIYSERNFYGIISVKDVNVNGQIERRLIDGTTSHGTQSLAADKSMIPLSYYRKNTGVGMALTVLQKQTRGINVGVVGLGAGTLAAYGRPQDKFHFYELNPSVIKAANNYFTYLSLSPATIAITQGDARVSLKNQLAEESNAGFDLLVIDAFSGDAVPQHLLTIEAFELYFRHLKPNGVLAVHVSNSHLDLVKLVKGSAAKLAKPARYFFTEAGDKYQNDAQWLLLANTPASLEHHLYQVYSQRDVNSAQQAENGIFWTDEYSNLLSILK